MPKVAPGDVVEAHLSKSKSNFIQASVDRIITSAPNRVQPSCQYFEKCGGCDYQMLPYEAQLHWKREIVREIFDRAKLPLNVEVATASGEPLAYRNRTQFHFEKGKVGFHQEHSHK